MLFYFSLLCAACSSPVTSYQLRRLWMRKEKRYPSTLSYDSAPYVLRDLNANKILLLAQQDIVTELANENSITSATQAESAAPSPTETHDENTSTAEPVPSAVSDSSSTDIEGDLPVVSWERLGYAAIFVGVVVALGMCTWCGGFRRIKGILRRDRAHYKRVKDEDLEK